MALTPPSNGTDIGFGGGPTPPAYKDPQENIINKKQKKIIDFSITLNLMY